MSRIEREGPANRRVVELFAGVGGFRLGLRSSGWNVIWSNQWEPHARRQWASECYVSHFGSKGHVCDDIENVVAAMRSDPGVIPDHELLTAGFPCQDYSVAKPLRVAHGIEGKKGVLWWSINAILEAKRPRYVLLENVDRLLNSPHARRGRDFAVILSCFHRLGYAVEWRVINAADFGFPQRRRRVFIVARLAPGFDDAYEVVFRSGVLATAFPILTRSSTEVHRLSAITDDPYETSERYGDGPFSSAGYMGLDGKYATYRPLSRKAPPSKQSTLGAVLERRRVPREYYIAEDRIGDPDSPAPGTWRYFKGQKSEPRLKIVDGRSYPYSFKEGRIAFPDALDMPARTILTSEGGSAPSRSGHVVQLVKGGRYRRLLPEELERLNGFRPGWTDQMPPRQRGFVMGNALVVGVVRRIGRALARVANGVS